MSNSKELNETSSNPTGQFGYTPIYTEERPSTDYQRGGAPAKGKTIIIADPWEVGSREYMLVVVYDERGKRTIKILMWHEHRMRWDQTDLPAYALRPLEQLAEILFFPASI